MLISKIFAENVGMSVFSTYFQKGGNGMSQDKLSLVKKFCLSPREATMDGGKL